MPEEASAKRPRLAEQNASTQPAPQAGAGAAAPPSPAPQQQQQASEEEPMDVDEADAIDAVEDDGDDEWEDEDDDDDEDDEDVDALDDFMERHRDYNLGQQLQQRSVTSRFFQMTNEASTVEARSSNNHFQCANSLCLASNNVAFVFDRKAVYVIKDMAAPQLVMRLDFRPICMTTKYGWVIAADDDGNMACFATAAFEDEGQTRTETEAAAHTLATRQVSTTMNNSVELFVDGDSETLRVLLSCNDCTVKVISFPSLHAHYTIAGFPYAINDSRMSPDGKMIACVGDGHDLFVVDVTVDAASNMMQFSRPRVVPVDLSGCHSRQYIVWNADSTCVACTSDTSTKVFVVDVKNSRIVQKIDANGPTFAIAFSPASPNLLAFSYRSMFVHVVDIVSGKRQFLQVPETINGLAFSPDGQHLHVATTSRLYRYRRLGIRSLLDTCVTFMHQHTDLLADLRQAHLPAPLQLRVFPLAPRARRPHPTTN